MNPDGLDDLFLIRGDFGRAIELRAIDDDGGDGTLMYGHFAVVDTWAEIDSWYEGTFIERNAAGFLKKTIRENRSTIKVAYDHGYDFNVGDSQLGPIDELREDEVGGYYEVPLLDTDYNRDRILPALQGRLMNGDMRGSQLGASYRFRVTRDEWVKEPKVSDENPKALPERTIREVRLFEFGPVNYPAFPEATADVRSLTDWYIERRLARAGRAERAARSISGSAGQPTEPGNTSSNPVAPAAGHPTASPKPTWDVRQRKARQILAAHKGVAGKR